MDPDVLLREIRALVRQAIRGGSFDAVELAERFADLDEWLTRGGFPPRDWRQV